MLRSQVGLPPLYSCVKCGLEIDLKSQYTLQMVKGWAKPTKKTLVKVEDEFPTYIHEHCLTATPQGMDTLF